jgi:hypothetical protein
VGGAAAHRRAAVHARSRRPELWDDEPAVITFSFFRGTASAWARGMDLDVLATAVVAVDCVLLLAFTFCLRPQGPPLRP